MRRRRRLVLFISRTVASVCSATFAMLLSQYLTIRDEQSPLSWLHCGRVRRDTFSIRAQRHRRGLPVNTRPPLVDNEALAAKVHNARDPSPKRRLGNNGLQKPRFTVSRPSSEGASAHGCHSCLVQVCTITPASYQVDGHDTKRGQRAPMPGRAICSHYVISNWNVSAAAARDKGKARSATARMVHDRR